MSGFLWLWRVQAGNLCALILDAPCRETWMVLGSPKGNCDPVGSPLIALQVVGGGGTGCFPCPSVFATYFLHSIRGEVVVGIFQAGKQKASGPSSLRQVFQPSPSRGKSVGTSCPAAPWPIDRVTAGFTSRYHPMSLGIWGS